jgi:hypothetical protein
LIDIHHLRTCCNKGNMDWDEFMKIPGCSISNHSDEKPVRQPKPSVSIDTPQVQSNPVPLLIQHAECPIPKEPDQKKPLVPLRTASGNFKCAHAGCSKEYNPDENTMDSCEYHEGTAGFRDTKKFWSCCGASSYDWDEFMKIPKCKRGKHEPKMIET